MIRRLTSAPKPAARVAPVHRHQVAVAVDPQSVANAVEARQVRRRLGRRDQVIGRQRVWRVRKPARLDRGAEALGEPRASPRSSPARRARCRPLGADQLLGHAESDARAGPRAAGSVDRARGTRPKSSRAGSWPTMCRSSSAASVDVARERTRLVERRGERDHPVARAGSVRRLHPDDPAQRGRLADRAAGVGADRPGRQTGGDGGRAPARGSARNASSIPRVQHRADAGVLVRGAHRELVLVGLAQQRRARVLQLPDDRRRVRRPVALEDPRAGLAGDAFGTEQVLDRERHAGQRRRGRSGGRCRRLVRDPRERVELVGGGALAIGVEQLASVESRPRAPARPPAAAVSCDQRRFML